MSTSPAVDVVLGFGPCWSLRTIFRSLALKMYCSHCQRLHLPELNISLISFMIFLYIAKPNEHVFTNHTLRQCKFRLLECII